MKSLYISALTALALIFGVVEASAAVYDVNDAVGTGGVSGFIQTDGTIGTLSDANIIDWNLVITTNGVDSFDLLGPHSGNNSQEGIFGTGFTATLAGLFFDFSLPATDYVLFESPGLLVDDAHFCLNGCSSSFNIGVGGDRASSNVTGDVEIGTAATPLPPALPLFATGLGVVGLLAWRRKRKSAVFLLVA